MRGNFFLVGCAANSGCAVMSDSKYKTVKKQYVDILRAGKANKLYEYMLDDESIGCFGTLQCDGDLA
ncbi:unnamed protein product, partial [Ceratitis capitata]